MQRFHRSLMSQWPTGVGLVTATGSDGPRGCTANAISSLSLDPPLLLVCFDSLSRTLEAVRHAGRFGVNMLATDQRRVSEVFATKATQAEKFGAVAHDEREGIPVLEGCLAVVGCEVQEEFTGGDHFIVVGRPMFGDIDPDRQPLMFFRAAYWHGLSSSAAAGAPAGEARGVA
jgi:3-hydroxy-9,10-secoandrosta-1,3,5(10)-triene-9,17-dione monooxygenase reductase component